MRSKILKKVKSQDDKKFNMNFLIPLSLKEGFEKACKQDGVKMSSILVSMIEDYIEEFNEEQIKNIQHLINQGNNILEMISGINYRPKEELKDLDTISENLSFYLKEESAFNLQEHKALYQEAKEVIEQITDFLNAIKQQ